MTINLLTLHHNFMFEGTSNRANQGELDKLLLPNTSLSPSDEHRYKMRRQIKSGILLQAFSPSIGCCAAWREGYDHSKDI